MCVMMKCNTLLSAEVDIRLEDIRLEAKAKDSHTEDRLSRGQVHEYSWPRPRTQAQMLSRKKDLQKKIFGDLQKKPFSKNFVRRSTNFSQLKKLCCPRAEDRAIFEAKDLTFEAKIKDIKMCPRGRLRGLHL